MERKERRKKVDIRLLVRTWGGAAQKYHHGQYMNEHDKTRGMRRRHPRVLSGKGKEEKRKKKQQELITAGSSLSFFRSSPPFDRSLAKPLYAFAAAGAPYLLLTEVQRTLAADHYLFFLPEEKSISSLIIKRLPPTDDFFSFSFSLLSN